MNKINKFHYGYIAGVVVMTIVAAFIFNYRTLTDDSEIEQKLCNIHGLKYETSILNKDSYILRCK